ncbi:lipopolysaccharide transport system ATP-binding protein [Desulfobaculum xiamenense]|uniref:Lipopolysaccharide transport system ATP-binding protein n=1 Tax=Desulfobaculum xiamenense TaxID=995050 RepID=A0A846QPT8_9BACT|nr:ABC transporter ATP-binding protein [Desulfobaculum xiamenense]NJB69197.1 lipopolysaccharide transport system ATP-binding protein [Desulfobaculum xiamenense]
MGETAIRVRGLSKRYRLGMAGTGWLGRDLQSWWARVRGREDPNAPLGVDGPALSRGHVWALRDVDLDVRRGEVVGVIGRNGAGKSTLLKILNRITLPTAGEARLKGRVAGLLEIGTGFHPELTGRENVFLNGAILGMTRAQTVSRFAAIEEFSEVGAFMDTPVKRYSSGMYVKLAFAVAAHLDPEIMLVDEVLAVGDAAFQKKCLGRMGDVAGQGRTVLFVSHNMASIRSLCTRCIVLEDGRVGFDGAPDAAVDRYLGHAPSDAAVLDGPALASRVDEYRPGPAALRVLRVAVCDDAGTPRRDFRSDEEVTVAVDYQCLRDLHDVRVILQLTDEGDVPLVAADSTDFLPPDAGTALGRGTYRTTLRLPARLFGERRFFVTVNVMAHGVHHLPVRRALDFGVSYQGFAPANIAVSRRVAGAVRPALRVSTTRLDGTDREDGHGGDGNP